VGDVLTELSRLLCAVSTECTEAELVTDDIAIKFNTNRAGAHMVMLLPFMALGPGLLQNAAIEILAIELDLAVRRGDIRSIDEIERFAPPRFFTIEGRIVSEMVRLARVNFAKAEKQRRGPPKAQLRALRKAAGLGRQRVLLRTVERRAKEAVPAALTRAIFKRTPLERAVLNPITDPQSFQTPKEFRRPLVQIPRGFDFIFETRPLKGA